MLVITLIVKLIFPVIALTFFTRHFQMFVYIFKNDRIL